MSEVELKRHPETGELVPEEWKVISGYDGLYEISNYGRVRSYRIERSASGVRESPKLLKPGKGGKGYLYVVLTNAVRYSKMVHRLVGETFIPNPYNKPNINHLDGIKDNNFYLNLEWCTQQENMQHAFDTGLMENQKQASSLANRGGGCADSKLTKKEVLDIRTAYESGRFSQSDLADIYSVTQPNINSIVNRKSWSHI